MNVKKMLSEKEIFRSRKRIKSNIDFAASVGEF